MIGSVSCVVLRLGTIGTGVGEGEGMCCGASSARLFAARWSASCARKRNGSGRALGQIVQADCFGGSFWRFPPKRG